MGDEELRRRLDGLSSTQAEILKRLKPIEDVTQWLSTKQPGREKTPLEQFIHTTDDVERGKLALRWARWVALAISAGAAATLGWWRDILDFARAANGGK
jgi:hypothetical protein